MDIYLFLPMLQFLDDYDNETQLTPVYDFHKRRRSIYLIKRINDYIRERNKNVDTLFIDTYIVNFIEDFEDYKKIFIQKNPNVSNMTNIQFCNILFEKDYEIRKDMMNYFDSLFDYYFYYYDRAPKQNFKNKGDLYKIYFELKMKSQNITL